jgi:hypothetical protein
MPSCHHLQVRLARPEIIPIPNLLKGNIIAPSSIPSIAHHQSSPGMVHFLEMYSDDDDGDDADDDEDDDKVDNDDDDDDGDGDDVNIRKSASAYSSPIYTPN